MNIPTTLIMEAISGLKSFGGTATSTTVAKLEIAVNNMNTLPTLDSLKAEVKRAGYTPSAASWEDSNNICAFSVETVPGCFWHPRFEATYSRTTGWLRIGNKSSSTFSDL